MKSLAAQPTIRDIKRSLQNLPTKLDWTYELAMKRIESQDRSTRKLAKKVLSWVVRAKRILSTSELQDALAVEPGEPELDKNNYLIKFETIDTICAGLIIIDTQNDTVRLVHYTTQEYLERTEEHWFPKAETHIAMTCVTYLLYKTFESSLCQTYEEF